MTRQEILNKLNLGGKVEPETVLIILETLGLVKFNKEIETLYRNDKLISRFGVISIEIWPEGLVVWVGGQIRYKSWEDK